MKEILDEIMGTPAAEYYFMLERGELKGIQKLIDKGERDLVIGLLLGKLRVKADLNEKYK